MTSTLELALSTLNTEVEKLADLSSSNSEPLDKTQTSQLTDIVKTLVAVSKNSREESKQDDLASLSDEQLQALVAGLSS